MTRFRIRKKASEFLSGVVDYLTSEVLDLSGQASFAHGKEIIDPRHIMLAIRSDEVKIKALYLKIALWQSSNKIK